MKLLHLLPEVSLKQAGVMSSPHIGEQYFVFFVFHSVGLTLRLEY